MNGHDMDMSTNLKSILLPLTSNGISICDTSGDLECKGFIIWLSEALYMPITV